VKPKTVYWLLWQLVKHILHRRGRDELFVAVMHDEWQAHAAVTDFSWTDDQDAFCMIDADLDPELISDEPYVNPGRTS
jgi:hypothetical protein